MPAAVVRQDEARRQGAELDRVERRLAALEPVEGPLRAVDEVQSLVQVVPPQALAPSDHEVADPPDAGPYLTHPHFTKDRIASATRVGWSSGVKV